MVHDNPPGKDFYNWTARCMSAGLIYNPYKVFTIYRINLFIYVILFRIRDILKAFETIFQVDWNPDRPDSCSTSEISLCRLGDLTRHGTIKIAGRKLYRELTRELFTDTILPLSGPNSLFGKSLVIYDDHGPVARGERLACSM